MQVTYKHELRLRLRLGRIFGRHFSGEIAFREADPLTVAGCLHQRGDLGQGGEGQQQADGSQDTAVDDAHRWTDEASNDEENTCYQCDVEGFHFFLLLNSFSQKQCIFAFCSTLSLL